MKLTGDQLVSPPPVLPGEPQHKLADFLADLGAPGTPPRIRPVPGDEPACHASNVSYQCRMVPHTLASCTISPSLLRRTEKVLPFEALEVTTKESEVPDAESR